MIKNKTQAKTECKRIKNSMNALSMLESGDDYEYLIEAFSKYHNDWESKKGVGVKWFYVDKAPNQFTTCIYVMRTDNTFVDISYGFKPDNRLNDIKTACRISITPIIKQYKEDNFTDGMLCPISNIILTKENSDVDHYNLTFINLFNSWIKNYDINNIHIDTHKGEVSSECNFINDDIKNEFIKYHNNNTHLRLIHRSINKSNLNKV